MWVQERSWKHITCFCSPPRYSPPAHNYYVVVVLVLVVVNTGTKLVVMLLTVLVPEVVLRSIVTIVAKTIQDKTTGYLMLLPPTRPWQGFLCVLWIHSPNTTPLLVNVLHHWAYHLQNVLKKHPTLWHVIEFFGKSVFLFFAFEKYEKQVKLNHFPKFLHEFYKKMETHHLHIYLKNSRCKANFHQRETPEKKRNCGSPACLQLFGRCDHLFRNRMPVINHSNPPPNDRDQPTYPHLCECFNHLRIWYLAIFTIFQGKGLLKNDYVRCYPPRASQHMGVS